MLDPICILRMYSEPPLRACRQAVAENAIVGVHKDLAVYRTELDITSRIFAYLDDKAFRNIALGENYFRLLGLDYTALPIGPAAAAAAR